MGAALFSAGAEAQVVTPDPEAVDRADALGEGPQGEASGNEIIVTAQFREQRLQDTPLAITAMDGETLKARDQKSVADLASFVPNVNITEAPSYYGNALSAFIRGVGQSDSSFALEPGIGIYVDDVYYGTTFGAVFDLTDLERVEVLRGPQGTLAGKNSLGGAVKLFTTKPDGELGGYLEGTYGRFDRVEARGGLNVPLSEELYARISGVWRRSDGYMTRLDYGCVNPGGGIPSDPLAGSDCKLGTEGGKNVKAMRVALRYAPVELPIEINLSGDISDDRSEPVAGKLLFANNLNIRSYTPFNPFAGVPFDSRFITGAESYTNYSNYATGGNYTTIFGIPHQVAPGTFAPEPETTAKGHGLAATVEIGLSDRLSLTSITAYRHAKGRTVSDFDGSPLEILLQALNFKHRQFTQELRLQGEIWNAVNYTVGGFYYDATDTLRARISIPDQVFDFITDDPVTNRSASLFAHAELEVLADLILIGGIRYTDDKKTYTFSRRNPDGSPILPFFFAPNFLAAGLHGLSGTFEKSHVDYRAGLNYRWSDNLMTYAQISTGFKGGGINPRPYVPDQVRNFGPETVTAYEAGFKLDLAGNLLRLNGAAFFNDFEDIQLTLYACPPSTSPVCAAPANAGSAHLKGAEVELVLHPAAGLTIEGALGHLDFDYTSVNPLTGVTLGMKAPFISKWQTSAGVQYEADLGTGGTITPRLDWSYQSAFFFNAVNRPENQVPGRNLFQARVTYATADRSWALSAGVTNLFDKFYFTGITESIAAYGVVNGIVGRPREWYVSLRRSF